MKKILFVYPHDYTEAGMGTNVRVKQLIKILNSSGCIVDLFALNHFANHEWNKTEIEGCRNLYLYDCSNDISEKNKVLKKAVRLFELLKGEYVHRWVSRKCKLFFDKIIAEEEYDVIIIMYSYLAYLTRDINNKKIIYFMDDCVFMQQFTTSKQRTRNLVTVGKILDCELKLLSNISHIFCISNDEKLLYEKFFPGKVSFFPHMLEELPIDLNNNRDKKWDIFYLGFDNIYNIEGINWFFKEVYPIIPKKYNILIGGKIVDKIDVDYDNVTKIRFIDNLDDAYYSSKVVICPMFSGTGMKTKVVEAMQRGIPVVCTTRGVDGFPDKLNNGCLVTDDPVVFANYIINLINDKMQYDIQSNREIQYYKHIFDKKKYLDELKNII